MALKPLYKMDSKGKIRVWNMDTELRHGVPHYVQRHGLLVGKKQETATAVKQGKNIGKKNETSPLEQCDLEAISLWNKKKDRKGYSETIPTDKPKLPMLAQTYTKNKKKITWPALIQPKLDGIRCMAVITDGKVVLKSRTNMTWKALDHIADALAPTIALIPGKTITLDGEFYNHDFKDDFQSLVSAIKRDDASVDSSLIQYHVYDLFAEWDFEDRSRFLLTHLAENESIKLVLTTQADTVSEFEQLYAQYIGDGYEGAILRNALGPYDQNRRSPNLQKFKEFIDDEFTIVGAYENKGKQAGQCTFECVTEKGAVFGVKPKGTDARRRQYWKDFQKGDLTGKKLTVRFFDWTTSEKPVPHFPVGIAIRDYE